MWRKKALKNIGKSSKRRHTLFMSTSDSRGKDERSGAPWKKRIKKRQQRIKSDTDGSKKIVRPVGNDIRRPVEPERSCYRRYLVSGNEFREIKIKSAGLFSSCLFFTWLCLSLISLRTYSLNSFDAPHSCSPTMGSH
ncbi:hypothetical protein KQX54_002424 [Cotesia glomerata]|uniref:Uncharacterized protein n=1 Tax=Cotesia glomerata TaxID=32391 RepID=A0AAV7I359_COTGL|nr:hypothetical protein KQX54_002424 [Cotesia glomerata]